MAQQIVTLLHIQNRMQGRYRHGTCNGCRLQHRKTVNAICQQWLTNQQSMTRLVAKQTGMVGAN